MNEEIRSFIVQLGKRLEWIIKEMELSKKDFGIKFNGGKEHKGISRYFCGNNMELNTLVKISNAFNLEIPYLLDLDNEDVNFKKYKNKHQFNFNILYNNLGVSRDSTDNSQLQIDVNTSIDRTSLSKYENGKINPRLDKIVELAFEYNIKPHILFIENIKKIKNKK